MIEPVFISSGFTYEKSALKCHYLKNGYVDPQTNRPIDPKIMIPN